MKTHTSALYSPMCLLALTMVMPSFANATMLNPAVETICVNTIPATTPTAQFTDNRNGTVTDNVTRLIWKRCSEGQTWNGTSCNLNTASYTWSEAVQRAQTVNKTGGFAGKKDWRLPTVKELSSIVERQCYRPAINRAIFADINYYSTGNFWSASRYAGYDGYAWYVNFHMGYNGADLKTITNGVWLVRGG